MAVSSTGTEADHIVARLSGLIQGIGLSVEEARAIVGRAIADDPAAAPADIEAKARAWMLIALA